MDIVGRKTFRGKTMAQAMIAMKQALGHNALFISHRKKRSGGLFGIGSKVYVEVVGEKLPDWMGKNRDSEPRHPARRNPRAPVAPRREPPRRQSGTWVSEEPALPSVGNFDDDLIVKNSYGFKGYPNAWAAPASPSAGASQHEMEDTRRETSIRKSAGGKRAYETPMESARQAQQMGEREHAREMEDVKSQIQELSAAFHAFLKPKNSSTGEDSAAGDFSANQVPEEIKPPPEIFADQDGFSGVLENLHRQLKDSGVPDDMAFAIIDRVARRTDAGDLDDYSLLRARVAKEIASMIRIAPPLDPNPDVPLIIVCVGATGVGKTTTLAKLGALFADDEARSIAFITLDKYRIAAVEQLRTFSNILNVPCEEAESAEELAEAVERHIDKEVILIDTAGRSPYHSEALQELKTILSSLRIDTELLLLVSATTDPREIRTVIDNFSLSERIRLVFTKVDEISCWGSIFAAAVDSRIPVAFCTTGQSVPDDIEPAEAVKFAEALLRGRDEPGGGALAVRHDGRPRGSLSGQVSGHASHV